MKNHLLKNVTEAVRYKLKDTVAEAIKKASEEVAAEMMVLLGEMITVELIERAGYPGAVEVHIIYHGLERSFTAP